jgi:uncharacterized repeat protein (TIGR01451 family)
MSESQFESSEEGPDPLLEARYSPSTAAETDGESTAESRVTSRPVLALLTGTAISLVGLVIGVGVLSGSSPAVELFVVPLVGIVAVLFGIGWLLDQFGSITATDLPAVEETATTVPGTDVDATLATERERRAPYGERTAIRSRLRRLVHAGLTRAGHTSDEADERIADEDWAEDPRAASFLTISGETTSRVGRLRRRLRARLQRVFSDESPFARDARHTVDAAATLIGVGDREWTGPDDPDAMGASAAIGGRRTIDLEPRVRATTRVRLVGGLVLLAVGLGITLRHPTLLLTGAVGTGVLAHRYAGGVPDPDLRVERRVAAADPDPGEAVTVTTTVENTGGSTLFDLRLVDGVPPTLEVVEGSPRRYTGLRPGASVTITYDVAAESGRHAFDPLGVVARSASGAVERTLTVECENETTLTCEPPPTPDVGRPVAATVDRTVGSVVTDTGGAGIEFHSVREYRSGDPLRRIDWRRLAQGGDLATRQFSVERSTTIVLVIDTRAEAFVAADADAPTAVDRSVDAARSIVRELLYSNDRVGLATIGPERCWIEPRGGASQWPLLREALATDEAFVHPDGSEQFLRLSTLHWLETRVPDGAQLVFFSPLTDDGSLGIARSLQARGYPVSVVSPRATGTDSPGRLVAHLERHLRLSRLRQCGLWAADWRPAEPLGAAFDRTERRRGR